MSNAKIRINFKFETKKTKEFACEIDFVTTMVSETPYFARFREKITKKCRIRERICTFGRIGMWTGLFNAVLLDYPCENPF